MTLDELRTHLRAVVLRDTKIPKLWTDETLVRYLNDAADELARRTHCLLDDSEDLSVLSYSLGVAYALLDERVVHVLKVFDADGHPLPKRSRFKAVRLAGTGTPREWDMASELHGERKLRLYPTPEANGTFQMLVARKPLKRMEADTDEPEFDEDSHLLLCYGAAAKALRNNDPEGVDMSSADDFTALWERGIADVKRNTIRLFSSRMQHNNWTGNVK